MGEWLEAEQRVERAQWLLESRRWAEALDELDAALAINPHNAMWHAHRGYILEEMSRPSEAVRAYRQSLDLEAGDRDVRMALALTLIRVGHHASAIRMLEQVTESCPDFEPAYCYRIRAYAEIGEHGKAEEMFYLAQQAEEDSPNAFFFMGESLAAVGDYDRAIACWRRVLTLAPDYEGVHQHIAEALRLRGEHAEAREALLCEIRRDPGNTELQFELGALYLEMGEPAVAAAKFGQIIELDPSHVDAHLALAELWIKRGEAVRAMPHLDHLRKLVQDDEEARGSVARMRGEALFQLGRFADARKEFDQALEVDPANADVLLLLGRSLARLEAPRAAADAYRRVLAHRADHIPARLELARTLLRLRQFEAALRHSLEVLRPKLDSLDALETAARACLELARWRDARRLLAHARPLASDDHAIHRLRRHVWRYRLNHLIKTVLASIRRLSV